MTLHHRKNRSKATIKTISPETSVCSAYVPDGSTNENTAGNTAQNLAPEDKSVQMYCPTNCFAGLLPKGAFKYYISRFYQILDPPPK